MKHRSSNDYPDELSNETSPLEISAKLPEEQLIVFVDQPDTDGETEFESVQLESTYHRRPDSPRPSKRENSSRRRDPVPGLAIMLSKIMWLCASLLLFVGVWHLGPRLVEQYHYSAIKGRVTAEHEVAKVALRDQPLADLSLAYRLVANRIRPSVVHIDTTSAAISAPTLDVPGFEELDFHAKGQGSGVIMDAEGYIVTNEHVVRSASEITVTLYDRRSFNATVVGTDVETDIAVLKIDAEELIAADWGDADKASFGSLVWAVGSPFGLTQSVTHGIVSANHRRVDNPYQDLIQTDAPMNPGNSGGPLVNSQGEVIGINTSILGKSYQGVSFAVSSIVARDVFNKLKQSGNVKRGFLGVSPHLVTHLMSLKLNLSSLDGAYINRVEPGSPADLAGIKEGDVIVAWNNVPIDTDVKLFRYVGMSPTDSTAEVTLIRNGAEKKAFVNVGQKPAIRR